MPSSPPKKAQNKTVAALFGVAVIQMVIGYIGYSMYGWDNLNGVQKAITVSGAFYLLLSLLAKKTPVAAASTGVILYGLYIGWQVTHGRSTLMSDLIFKVPVL